MVSRIRFPWFMVVMALVWLLSACGENGSDAESSTDEATPAGQNAVEENDTNTPVSIKPNFIYTPLALPVEQPGDTFRISLNSEGFQGNQNSINADIDAAGRLVVFDSAAGNLVDTDTNATWDVFLRDRRRDLTLRLSQTVDGFDANGASIEPKISADGRHVVFSSIADNLVDNDTNGVSDIFVYDIESAGIVRVSVNATGEQADAGSFTPAISGDGRWIVYASTASNLLDDGQAVNHRQIYLFDTETGAVQRISTGFDNSAANADCANPTISRDGTVIAYGSSASNLVANDTNNQGDIFVYQRSSQETTRVSVASNGSEANSDSVTPALNGNGTVVAFQSNASNLVANDANMLRDIFVHDRASRQTRRVSVNSDGSEGNGTFFASPDITDQGNLVTFYGLANNLANDDLNQAWDAFVHQRDSAQTDLVSRNSDAEVGNASSFEPAISAGGHYVVFGSQASNLAANDTNAAWDIFLHVLSPANHPPSVEISADVVSGEPPLTVQFTSRATDVEQDGLLYEWDFGDGSSSTEANPSHEYLTPGRYSAILTVMDPEYATRASVEINVISPLAVTVHKAKLELRHSDQRSLHRSKKDGKSGSGSELDLKILFDGDVQLADASRIRVDFAGLTVLDTAFDAFVVTGRKHQVYKLHTKDIEAKINFDRGYLKLKNRDLDVSDLTHFEDLAVVLTLGDLQGDDIISLRAVPCGKSEHRQYSSNGDGHNHDRPDCEAPNKWIYHRPHDSDHGQDKH